MLIVRHPASFLEVILLVAVFERALRCFLAPHLLRSSGRKLAGWLLGMSPFESEGDGHRRAVNACCEALEAGEAVLVYVEERAVTPGRRSQFSPAAARAAVQAESRESGHLGLKVIPLQLFSPGGRLHHGEFLVFADTPLAPADLLSEGKDSQESARALTNELEEACRRNVFRLREADLSFFLADLEEILRLDLEESWKLRTIGNQKASEFKLSGFVKEWAENLNGLDPGRLVAFREMLEDYREIHRRCALGQLEVAQAGDSQGHSWRQLAIGLESALGLPLALAGAANHLAIGLVLYYSGLLKKSAEESSGLVWAGRALLILAAYTIQISLCAHWWGRNAAGAYALLLPLSGAYLWRYVWLLRHRTRFMLLGARVRRQASKLGEMRKNLVAQINAARDAEAEAMGLPQS